jgi:hypothetical protein
MTWIFFLATEETDPEFILYMYLQNVCRRCQWLNQEIATTADSSDLINVLAASVNPGATPPDELR